MIRSQSDIYNSILPRQRDTSNARWSKTEIYNAINDSLDEWRNRVSYPVTYNLASFGNAYEYDIPYWMGENVELQQYVYTDELEQDVLDDGLWQDVPAQHIEVSVDGTRTIVAPYLSTATNGRLVTWLTNGPLPNADIELTSNITASSDEIVLETASTGYAYPEAGHVKVGTEWMFYAGVDSSSYPSSITLENVRRGQVGTTAATHSDGDAIEWGVFMTDGRLAEQLRNQVASKMHELFLTDASPHELDTHKWIMRWNQDKVRMFWRTWTPQRQAKMRLSRRGVGL